jgi:hypothetical protein
MQVFYKSKSLAQQHAAQHSVHPTGGSRRVFKLFVWLEAGSVKMALSRPAHPRVTQSVRPLERKTGFAPSRFT